MWSLGYIQVAENDEVSETEKELLNSTEKNLPEPENLVTNKSLSDDESDSEITNESSINPINESDIKNQANNSNNEIEEDFVMIENNQLIDKKADENLTLKPSKIIIL
jgi:hypothetical protein